MKKTIQTIVMATLCLIFKAEAQDNKAVDVTTKGIQIGQKVPDFVINNLHNYKDAKGKPVNTLKLSGLNEKLIILDFWATWCSPCVAMIPKMEALQTQFKGEVLILPVTYQTKDVALPFLKKLKNGAPLLLPQVTDDKELNSLFPHIYLPHYVWIDYTGTVRAITGPEEITAENIDKVLDNAIGKYGLQQKRDMKVAFDKTKPFLINGNGGDGNSLIYHSVLSRFQEGLPYGWSVFPDSSKHGRVLATNLRLEDLYQLAFWDRGYFLRNRRILLVKDSLPFRPGDRIDKEMWKISNCYNYELIVPPALFKSRFQLMRDDLEKIFYQYHAVVEKRLTKCLALVRTTELDKIRSSGAKQLARFDQFGAVMQNAKIGRFISQLNSQSLQDSKIPIVDDTGYAGRIDLSIQAKLNDVDAINKALEIYDLKFVVKDCNIDMLVIRDKEI